MHLANEDKGVISPTAALSSMPYTPEQSMQGHAALVHGFEGQHLRTLWFL